MLSLKSSAYYSYVRTPQFRTVIQIGWLRADVILPQADRLDPGQHQTNHNALQPLDVPSRPPIQTPGNPPLLRPEIPRPPRHPHLRDGRLNVYLRFLGD